MVKRTSELSHQSSIELIIVLVRVEIDHVKVTNDEPSRVHLLL
jgi:hypothetical protein